MNRSGSTTFWTKIAVASTALVVGWIGFAGLFSDLGPEETVTERIGLVAGAYIIGCGLIGALMPFRWYMAATTAWGPVFVSILMLTSYVFLSGEPASNPGAFILFWLLALIGVPAFALACGYVGSWLRRRGHDRSA